MNSQALVSIVIPTKNSVRTLSKCLQSIAEQTYTACEVIVVDNHSTDGTQEIARQWGAHLFTKGPERSAQRNYGAKKSHGEYLLFIDSDMVLGKNVVKECIHKCKKKGARAVVIPETSFGQGFWAECKAFERSCYLGVPWMEAARFFERALFVEFGGYDEGNTGTEDFDLPQRMKNAIGDSFFSRIHTHILHDEGRLRLIPLLKKKYYYGRNVSLYASKKENKKHFTSQSSILQRYLLFFHNRRTLFKKPQVFLGAVCMKTLEFAAGALGLASAKLQG